MFNYSMSPSGKIFHESDKFIKAICGPFGSGKSCACAVDVLTYACAQAPAPDGNRYSRVGVIRATYPELLSTTRKSLEEVIPPGCGKINGSGAPVVGNIVIPLMDGTTVQLELNLLPLANPDDCLKIRSHNWTFAWINEATGICPEVFDAVLSRVGRYPSENVGGVSWGGVIMDFNMPDRASWLYSYLFNPPVNWLLVKQPPAAFTREDEHGHRYFECNPDAENLTNLGSREEGDPTEFASAEEEQAYLRAKGMRYYRNQIEALVRNGREDKVRNLYCMEDVPLVEGKPVYSGFSYTRHVASDDVSPNPFQEILIGMDQSGIHPAAVILQNQRGKWIVLDELYGEGEGLENFLYGMLVPLLREKYSSNTIIAAIDPSNTRDSWTATPPRQRLEDLGITAVTEISNNPKLRIQTVEHMLNLEVGGLLVSPKCDLLIRGFQSEYKYRKLRASGTIGAAYTPTPEKNDSSHVHDALQYAALLINLGVKQATTDMDNVARVLSDRRRMLRRIV